MTTEMHSRGELSHHYDYFNPSAIKRSISMATRCSTSVASYRTRPTAMPMVHRAMHYRNSWLSLSARCQSVRVGMS